MKFKNLAGFGLVALAAASFAMASTTAMAKTQSKNHSSSTCSKNVKCYGVNKSGTGYVLVSKSACDQIGGSTTNPNASTATPAATDNNTNNNNTVNPNTATPSMTNPGATPPSNTGTPGNNPTGGVTTTNPNQ